MTGPTLRHHYVAVGGRLVHYIRAGQGPLVVLLHASPGDGRTLHPLAARLAERCTVLAPDTPGHGWSDPLPAPAPRISDYGAALLETMDALQLRSAHLYGTHTGAKIALHAAAARPDRVATLVLDGLGIATPEERADQLAHYTPDHPPRSDGSHLVAAWHQVRNMFRFWPWYAESAAARLTGAEPDPADLHVLVHGLLLAGARYPLAYRAAFGHDPLGDLSRLCVPTLLLAAPDDPLHAQLGRIGALPAKVQLAPGPGDVAARIAGHVAAHGGSVPPLPAASSSPPPARCFVHTTAGDVHVSRAPNREVGEVIIAPLGAYADEPVADGTAVVELPGSGRSSLRPGTEPAIAALAEALTQACAALELRPRLVRSSGSTAAVAVEFARRLGATALVAGRPDPRLPERLISLQPRADGAHLLAAWHLVRDAAIRELGAAGRWPGASGAEPDLALLQTRTVAIAGCWDTLSAVSATRANGPGPSACDDESGRSPWDPLAAARSER